jgi:hypothetical protein
LRTDCENGFSRSEFIGQIVEIVAFFPLSYLASVRFAAALKKMQADEDGIFVLMF